MERRENNITELVFILDRSGSMSGLEADRQGAAVPSMEKPAVLPPAAPERNAISPV